MIIVNDKENIPKNILFRELGERNKEIINFLDTITSQGYNNGVKRESYYIININGIIRFPGNGNAKLIHIFVKFIEMCQTRGYDLLMIKI